MTLRWDTRLISASVTSAKVGSKVTKTTQGVAAAGGGREKYDIRNAPKHVKRSQPWATPSADTLTQRIQACSGGPRGVCARHRAFKDPGATVPSPGTAARSNGNTSKTTNNHGNSLAESTQ
ncbi:hypothetical protein Xcc3_21740 [Xanthomonas campestris pv. campestris]|nr:hypothetical protein Xcc1_21210 [Xanthomonas campestris pv. campestris]BBK00867.1 hypothetical protein Xcc3_21740 [Xanthomonas campestris pv. campestris]